MTRNEYEELETLATATLVGMLAGGKSPKNASLASIAFDLAEQFQKERIARIGEKPPYDQ